MKTHIAVVERCPETGLYVAYIPGLLGAHTQAATLDELNENLNEVIELISTSNGDWKITLQQQ